MTYENEQVHKDILAVSGYKKLVFDEKVFLFHAPSLSIVSTGLKEEEYDISDEELRELEESLPDTSSGVSFESKVDIRAVALNVAEQCNLRCVYCYAGDGDYGKNEKMKFSVGQKALDLFVGKHKSFTVVFFGGEPLLNFSLIKETVEYAKKAFPDTKFNYRMTTNGLLLTSSIMQFLKENNVSLTISYDGATAQKKQRLNLERKQNERDFVLERIEKFKNDLASLEGFKIRSTVTADMIDAFEGDFLEIKKNLPFHTGFNRTATDNPDFKYGLNDAKKLMDTLERVVDELLNLGKFKEILSLDNIGGHLKMIHGRQFLSKTCGAGVNYLSVSTDGNFYLCHRFTEDSDEKIGSIKQGLDYGALEAIVEHRRAVHEPCNSCWMKSICRGGCFHENKVERGTKHKPDPIFCYMQDRTIKMAIKSILRIKKEQPELLPDTILPEQTEDTLTGR